MDPSDDPTLPDRLRDDLAALYGAHVRVPPEMDRSVISGARAQLAGRGRWLRWAGAVAAAAAVIAVTLVLYRPHDRTPTRVAGDYVQPDGDADGNATVDIRDALALARKVEAGNVAWTRWEDVNRDKVIDRKDVDAIATLVVRLTPEAMR